MTEKQFRWLTGALIVFAAFLAYANTFANEFVWDDASSILLHQDVQNPARFARLFTHDQHAYGRGQGNFYRPLVSVSFMIDTWLARPSSPGPQSGQPAMSPISPFLYHVSNILWHAAVGVALFALMTLLGAPRPVRLLAPLLYIVHPLHTEAIAYISGRADPMASFFMLAALCCAIGLPEKRNAGWCAGLFGAALLSKESAVIFPFLLLLAVIIVRNRPDSPDTAQKPASLFPLLVCGAMLGGYAVLRMTVLHFGGGGASNAAPLLKRLAEAGQAFALYLQLIFAPRGLHMERTLDGVPASLAVLGWILIAVFVASAIGAYRARKNRLALALGFFLVAWLPISGIFPLNAPMAEHWMYLPMLGFVWAVIEILWMALGRGPLRYALYGACYVACVALVAMTAQRNYDWRSNQSIYVATLEKSPASIRVNFNLGVTYEDITGNPSGARRQFERVLELYRERKAARGETGAAESFYEDELEAHLSLGRIYAGEQLLDQAAYHFELLRRVDVNDSNANTIGKGYLEYAKLLMSVGRADDARKLLDEGIQRIPALKQQKEAYDKAQPSADQPATELQPPAG